VAALLMSAGCASHVRVPLVPFYERAVLDDDRVDVRLDVAYRQGAGVDPDKHSLDLFLPREPGWPLLAFVHGGSLENGDKALRVGGHDIYRNIGRFFSARGVGVALVNYRLQPDVSWPDQVDDVAAATAWLVAHAHELGGDGRVYLSGHSAGAWLAAHVGFDDAVLRRHGLEARDLDGVFSVSGSGFDLTDERTWEMFGRRKKWERRFAASSDDLTWKERASVVPLIDGGHEPPVLLLYSEREWEALARQNRLFCDALRDAGQRCEIEAIDGLGHRLMVLALSRADGPPARRILEELGVSARAAIDGTAPVASSSH
jgi:acetyl esterase/lipase